MRYIDTLNRNEWSPNYYGEEIPPHVIPCDSNPFFSAIPYGKKLSWVLDELPILVDMDVSEYPPAPEKFFSPKEFIEKFTIEELRLIYNHATINVDVRIWLDRLTGAAYVVLSDSALLAGMAYMVYQELITQERYLEIMEL